MYNKNQLCEKIRSVHKDIGKCGIDINVEYGTDNKAWVVHLRKGNLKLKTYLEPEDANICMDGKHCIGLVMQISQLKDNIVNMKYS